MLALAGQISNNLMEDLKRIEFYSLIECELLSFF